MKFLLVLATIFTQYTLMAQTGDTWKLCSNKTILASGTVDENRSVHQVQASVITKKAGEQLTLLYKQANATKNWNRTFFITDENEQELHTIKMNTASGQVAFPAKYLLEMAANKKAVLLYTSSLPKDAGKAATVRVRRIFLGKIEWK